MRHLIAVLGALAWIGSAHSFELKGLKPGMTLPQIRAVQPDTKWTCEEVTPKWGRCLATDVTGKLATVADQKVVRIVLSGGAGPVINEVMFFLGCGVSTEELATSFMKQFGEPSIKTKDRDGLGKVVIWGWENDGGDMYLSGYGKGPSVCHSVWLYGRKPPSKDF
jgi:hypothetical protein